MKELEAGLQKHKEGDMDIYKRRIWPTNSISVWRVQTADWDYSASWFESRIYQVGGILIISVCQESQENVLTRHYKVEAAKVLAQEFEKDVRKITYLWFTPAMSSSIARFLDIWEAAYMFILTSLIIWTDTR